MFGFHKWVSDTDTATDELPANPTYDRYTSGRTVVNSLRETCIGKDEDSSRSLKMEKKGKSYRHSGRRGKPMGTARAGLEPIDVAGLKSKRSFPMAFVIG